METVILSACMAGVLYSAIFFVKVENAYNNHMKILKAIDGYVSEGGDAETGLLALNSMEHLSETIHRFTDWGCKNILPKEYFELIKPYIQ